MAAPGDADGTPDPREVHDAMRLFLRQQTDALQRRDPAAARAACDLLLDALGPTLRGLLPGTRDSEGGAGGDPPPLDQALHLEPLDAGDREALARTVLLRRAAEAEGALLHLRLTLSRLARAGSVASATGDERLEPERRAALDALEGVGSALRLWTAAASAGEAPAVEPPSPQTLLRLARACLHVDAVGGAAPLLRAALLEALAAPLRPPRPRTLQDALSRWQAAGASPRDVPLESCRDLDERLARLALDDALTAWVLLDAVERVANAATMTPAPAGTSS